MSKPRRPRRPIHGILLLDKPTGVTSNHILQWIKHRYQADKAGHTGSLDPLATGLLPICLGEATKFSHYLLDADKTYHVRLKLGEKTSTADSDGEVIDYSPVPPLTAAKFAEFLSPFRGETLQIPSMYSALKYQGKPLYEYARAGIEVPRQARPIHVYQLDLLAFELPFAELRVHCSKGTYIRNLVEDIGEAIGCGAHVVALRREQTGPFVLADALVPEQISAKEQQGLAALDACLLPVWSSIVDLPMLEISENSAYYFRQGNPVRVNGLPANNDDVRVYQQVVGSSSLFLGVGHRNDDGLLAPKRLIQQTVTLN